MSSRNGAVISFLFVSATVFLLASCLGGPTPEASPSPTIAPATAIPPTIAFTSTPTPSPTPRVEPTPTPQPTVVPAPALEIPELDQVKDELGFALVPRHVPDGFKPASAAVSSGTAFIRFQRGQETLTVAYPVNFSTEDPPIMKEIGLIRPTDALSETTVNGVTAHFMKGGWSDATIIAGPSIDPANAEWEYDKSLALFFEVTVLGDRLGVAIQASPGKIGQLQESELERVAESLVTDD